MFVRGAPPRGPNRLVSSVIWEMSDSIQAESVSDGADQPIGTYRQDLGQVRPVPDETLDRLASPRSLPQGKSALCTRRSRSRQEPTMENPILIVAPAFKRTGGM